MNADNGSGLWLKPSEALTRFSLPKDRGEGPGSEEVWQEHRYGFVVGNIGLLLAKGTHSEIPERSDIYPFPGVPSWFRGLISQRGTLVPVFDLGQLFGKGDGKANHERVLILDRGRKAVGILIEGFPRAMGRLRALPKQPPVPEVLDGYVPEAFGDGERVWLEFDHQGFFRSLAARFKG